MSPVSFTWPSIVNNDESRLGQNRACQETTTSVADLDVRTFLPNVSKPMLQIGPSQAQFSPSGKNTESGGRDRNPVTNLTYIPVCVANVLSQDTCTSRRTAVFFDFFFEELVYSSRLQTFVQTFLKPIEFGIRANRIGWITWSEYQMLFQKYELIAQEHLNFVSQLTKHYEILGLVPENIGVLMKIWGESMEMYCDFARLYDQSFVLLEKIVLDPQAITELSQLPTNNLDESLSGRISRKIYRVCTSTNPNTGGFVSEKDDLSLTVNFDRYLEDLLNTSFCALFDELLNHLPKYLDYLKKLIEATDVGHSDWRYLMIAFALFQTSIQYIMQTKEWALHRKVLYYLRERLALYRSDSPTSLPGEKMVREDEVTLITTYRDRRSKDASLLTFNQGILLVRYESAPFDNGVSTSSMPSFQQASLASTCFLEADSCAQVPNILLGGHSGAEYACTTALASATAKGHLNTSAFSPNSNEKDTINLDTNFSEGKEQITDTSKDSRGPSPCIISDTPQSLRMSDSPAEDDLILLFSKRYALSCSHLHNQYYLLKGGQKLAPLLLAHFDEVVLQSDYPSSKKPSCVLWKGSKKRGIKFASNTQKYNWTCKFNEQMKKFLQCKRSAATFNISRSVAIVPHDERCYRALFKDCNSPSIISFNVSQDLLAQINALSSLIIQALTPSISAIDSADLVNVYSLSAEPSQRRYLSQIYHHVGPINFGTYSPRLLLALLSYVLSKLTRSILPLDAVEKIIFQQDDGDHSSGGINQNYYFPDTKHHILFTLLQTTLPPVAYSIVRTLFQFFHSIVFRDDFAAAAAHQQPSASSPSNVENEEKNKKISTNHPASLSSPLSTPPNTLDSSVNSAESPPPPPTCNATQLRASLISDRSHSMTDHSKRICDLISALFSPALLQGLFSSPSSGVDAIKRLNVNFSAILDITSYLIIHANTLFKPPSPSPVPAPSSDPLESSPSLEETDQPTPLETKSNGEAVISFFRPKTKVLPHKNLIESYPVESPSEHHGTDANSGEQKLVDLNSEQQLCFHFPSGECFTLDDFLQFHAYCSPHVTTNSCAHL